MGVRESRVHKRAGVHSFFASASFALFPGRDGGEIGKLVHWEVRGAVCARGESPWR